MRRFGLAAFFVVVLFMAFLGALLVARHLVTGH